MSNNTKLGVGSLNSNNGSKNTAIGAYASYKNTEGFSNTSLGVNAGFFNETGDFNTSLGSAALCNNLNGSSNTAIGSNALLGKQTLSIGNSNTGVGVQSLEENTGDFNTALGAQSGLDLTGGSYNTYLGAKTNASSQDLNHSTAIGYGAIIDASNQIMMGTATENVQVPGNLNVINGQATFNGHYYGIGQAVGDNTNTVIGKVATPIVDVSANHSNVFIGNNILKRSGRVQNVAVGNRALENGGTLVDKTVAIGYEALKNYRADDTDPNNDVTRAPGTSSVAVGAFAGVNCKDCKFCTFLGTDADVDNSGISYNYSTAIGYNAKIDDSNQIMMGTASETVKVPGNLEVDGPAYLTNYVNQNDPNQVVPKSYVDALASGIVPTQSCLCATTGDLTLTGIPVSNDTDGVELVDLSNGSYNILVRAQNNQIENGVYIFTKNGGSGSWARPPYPEPMHAGTATQNPFDANAAFSFVASGEQYGKTGLVQILDPAIVGTNDLSYTEFYQLQVNAGEGLNTTVQSGQLYINVDTSLNIVEYLDNNAGDLHLGAGDTTGNVVIGKEDSSQTTTIQNQANFVQNDITVSSGSNRNVQIGSGPNDLQNIRIGNNCLTKTNMTGTNNIAIGYNVLKNIESGVDNMFVGTGSGQNLIRSKYNVGFGKYALTNYDYSGNGLCTAIGHNAGQKATGGHKNTFLGADTDFDDETIPHVQSTAIGYNAKITDSYQIMMGTANENVQVPGKLNVDGQSTLQDVEVPGTLNVDGQSTLQDVEVPGKLNVDGQSTMKNVQVDETLNVVGQATFNGHYYGIAGANGDNTNTVIGKVEITTDVSANHSNVFIGNNILEKYSGRIQNVAIGNGALENGGTTVDKTVAIGYEALKNFRIGDNFSNNNDEPGTSSVAVGHRAGLNCKDCTYCTFLGTGADVDNSGVTYNQSTALGRNAKITDSNQIMMGTASETVEVPGTLSYQSFRQPIIFNCQIKRDGDSGDSKGYYIDTKSPHYGFNTNYEGSGVFLPDGNTFILQVECYAQAVSGEALDSTYNVQVNGRASAMASARKYAVTLPEQNEITYNSTTGLSSVSRFNVSLETELDTLYSGGIVYVTVFYYPPS